MTKPNILHRLSFKFNIALLAMLLLTLAGSVYIYSSTTTHFQKRIAQEFANSSQSLNNSLTLIQRQLLTAVKNAGSDPTLANELFQGNKESIQARIENLREFNGVDLLLLRKNDRLLLGSSTHPLPLTNKTFHLGHLTNETGETIIPYYIRLNSHLFFCCEERVMTKSSPPFHLIAGLNITSKYLHSLSTNSHIEISVVQDGTIAYSTLNSFLGTTVTLPALTASSPGLPEVMINNEKFYTHTIGFHHQPNIVFLLSHSKNDITKLNRSVLVKLAGFLLLLIIFLLLFGLFCTKNFLHPIRKLTDAINSVSTGKFDGHLTFEANNELQVMANHFNTMTDFIRERDANLEHLVNERTESLAKQNTFIDTILSSASELGIIAADPSGDITYANPTAEKLFSYNAADVIGHPLKDHHCDAQTTPVKISNSIEQLPENNRFFYTIRHKKSNNVGEKQIECTITEMLSRDKVLSGYLLLARDVTLTKQMDQRLKNTLAELDIIFENSSLAIVYEHQGTVARVNKAFESMFGFRREEVLGQAWQPFFETLHDGKTDSFWDKSTEAYYVQNKEDAAFWVTINKRSLEPNNSRASAIWIFENVTKQKEAELKIKQLSLAVEQSPNSIIITDTTGTIQYVNPAFSRTTGYSYDEAIGQKPSILQSGKTSAATFKDMWQTIREGSKWSGQFTNKTKAGKLYEEHVTIAPIRNEAGDITHFIATKENITELKEARRQADQANQAKGEFLANMSHEIRTPMNLIFGMTELLLDTDLADEQRTFLKRIQTAGTNLLALINDILDYSKIESGRLIFEKKSFALKELFAELEGSLALSARQKGLHFQCLVEEPTASNPVGDRLRLYQVLMNLAGNAIKFTVKGKVEVKGVVTDDDPSHYAIQFTVKDTGIGIRPETQEMIFNSFAQANSSITREFGGSGLGLAISCKLVTLMGGTIKVASTPGLGSIFSFSLRFPKGADIDSKPPPIISQLPATPLRILVVEDNQANQELVELMLQKDSHQVTLCSNGLEALKMLTSSTFDVVLLDVQMPIMDGLTATAIIRKFEQGEPSPLPEHPGLQEALTHQLRGKHLFIIAMTANAMTGDREKCLTAGTDGYLPKPYSSVQLRAVLSQIDSVEKKSNDTMDRYSIGEPEDSSQKVASIEGITHHLQSNFSVGEEKLPSILKSFLHSIAETMVELSSALENGSYNTAAKHTHRLKGSLLNLGLHYQSAIAQQLEHCAHDSDQKRCNTLFQALEKELAPLLSD